MRETYNTQVSCGALLFFAFTFGMTAMAAAQAMPPPNPPNIRYILLGAVAGYPADRLWEGRGAIRAASRKIRERATNQVP